MKNYKQALYWELKTEQHGDLFAFNFATDTDATSPNYICDAISDYADSYTSIYYSNIKDFIINNFDAVEATISEFGWDGCGKDLYKAGQLAEYLQNERILYDNLRYIVRCIAWHYIDSTEKASDEAEAVWNKLQDKEKNKILTEYVAKFDQIDNNNRFCDIVDIFDDFAAELENWGK